MLLSSAALFRPNNGVLLRRLLSSEQFCVSVYQVDSSGAVSKVDKSLQDLVQLKAETKLPIRDLRLFFQPRTTTAATNTPQSAPLLLSRPSSKCYILSLAHVKLLCR